MDSSNKLVTSTKTIVTILLIAMQVVWLLLLVNQVSQVNSLLSGIFQFLSIVMALYIVDKDDVAAYRMGWVLLIIIAPICGGLIYLIWGDKRSSIFMRKKLHKGKVGISEYLKQKPEVSDAFSEAMPRAAGCAHYLSGCGFPVWQNTQVKYHSLGDYQFADMIEELKKAEKYIFIEYFIIQEGIMWGTVLDILREKAANGVDVRIIYDDFGCLSKLPNDYHKKIERMGIKCLRFNPIIPIIAVVMNNRDHRKMMIVDGKVAFTGGLNLADEYINQRFRFGHWKDSGLMLKGDAVWNFTVMFLEMWNAFRPGEVGNVENYIPEQKSEENLEAEGFVQPFSDSPFDYETVTVNLYTDMISRAKDYIYIFTPYLAISDEMMMALRTAAKRGVDVRIVIPGIPDKKLTYRLTRSYTIPLMRAGIRIYEYTPGFIHSKSYVCDDETAVVGTINSDYRSLYLQFECGVLMSGNQAVLDVRDDALRTFEISHEVTMDERIHNDFHGYIARTFDALIKIFAPLF